ncbi:hypothetical protein BC628DRAFT_1089966 [Trametes gibbosa]|nr:hypothetical protein BC628DRAFT_1089966 [Trametes gibbosa]
MCMNVHAITSNGPPHVAGVAYGIRTAKNKTCAETTLCSTILASICACLALTAVRFKCFVCSTTPVTCGRAPWIISYYCEVHSKNPGRTMCHLPRPSWRRQHGSRPALLNIALECESLLSYPRPASNSKCPAMTSMVSDPGLTRIAIRSVSACTTSRTAVKLSHDACLLISMAVFSPA